VNLSITNLFWFPINGLPLEICGKWIKSKVFRS